MLIDDVNYGMSPIDCPQMVIEDVLFDTVVASTGTVIQLKYPLNKAISNYAVFYNEAECKTRNKTDDSFEVYGYDGTVDIKIIGKRADSTDVYWKVMQ